MAGPIPIILSATREVYFNVAVRNKAPCSGRPTPDRRESVLSTDCRYALTLMFPNSGRQEGLLACDIN